MSVSCWHLSYRSPAHSVPGDLYRRLPLQINLFSNSRGFVDLYSKIPHCAFQLRVAKQQLYRTQVSGPTINRLRSPAANACHNLQVQTE